MSKKPNYDHFKQFADDVEGYADLNKDTMAIPFIRIVQALSAQRKKNNPSYNPEAEEGMIVNSVTNELYDTPLRFVVGKFERLFIEWKPNRGGFVGAHAPESIENNPRYALVQNEKGGFDLIDQETRNVLVDTYMYYVLLPDHMEEGVCIIAMSMTQLKIAKRLNRMLMTTVIPGTQQKALPHFMIWNFETAEVTKDQNSWYAPVFTFNSFVTPDQLEYVATERKSLPDKKVDYAQIDETAGKQQEPQGDVPY